MKKQIACDFISYVLFPYADVDADMQICRFPYGKRQPENVLLTCEIIICEKSWLDVKIFNLHDTFEQANFKHDILIRKSDNNNIFICLSVRFNFPTQPWINTFGVSIKAAGRYMCDWPNMHCSAHVHQNEETCNQCGSFLCFYYD